ncbi:drug resistance transporter, EmrB/QacA subfamily [Virgibacillus subterraneus]|uniref:Drug resistance transporter, EmrB/QacA subfamily n=1 Tax=Virgibacillus subterraneus TaxID=621109 RepID=A0A1H9I8F4_9BACI|nr:drug resistance transporter, EmrB/QacA subfamily [Virgibacillus subterraneus]
MYEFLTAMKVGTTAVKLLFGPVSATAGTRMGTQIWYNPLVVVSASLAEQRAKRRWILVNEKRNKSVFVLTGLLAGLLMAGMDSTVVATALPSIVGDLGGFDKFIWVTSAYLVMMMASTPIFGKLSDMYGRKRYFIFGLLSFLFGSMLCGTAGSMLQLIIYRAVQGIGGGALMPIAFTIVVDIFPPEKRGKMMGLVGAVFGISSIFGSLLGAFITEYVSWHWVFFVNLPIGMLSLLIIVFFYHESFELSQEKIDWWGAITLALAVIALMLALQLGGMEYDWGSPFIIGLFTVFVALLVVFLYIETRAADPIISFSMFKDRLFTTSCVAALFIGAAYITAITYIPIFVQGVFGGRATNAGLILMPMMLSSVIGSQAGGFLTSKTSYRNIMIIASVFFVPGIFLLGTLDSATARLIVTLYMAIIGFGAGFSFSVLSMAAMHNFDFQQRGSASSTNRFSITLGMTIGITVFGIVQRNIFTTILASQFANVSKLPNTRSLLSPKVRNQMSEEVLDEAVDALSSSIAFTFIATLVPAVLGVFSILLMSNERIQPAEENTSTVSDAGQR